MQSPEYRRKLAAYKRGQAIGRAIAYTIGVCLALVLVTSFFGGVAFLGFWALVGAPPTFLQVLGVLLLAALPALVVALMQDRPNLT